MRAIANLACTLAVCWSGDYQTGDFSQWDRMQALPGGAMIVLAPGRSGLFAARYRVRPGDDPVGSRGERAAVRASPKQTGAFEGQESWYGWSTYLPAAFNPPWSSRNSFTQFHQTVEDGCPPNLAFQADTSAAPAQIKVRVRGGTQRRCRSTFDREWTVAELRTPGWLDTVLHVSWSSDPAQGFVEMWLNRVQVVPKTMAATLYAGQSAYLEQGFFREASPLTSVVYHAGMRRGTSYSAVAPGPGWFR